MIGELKQWAQDWYAQLKEPHRSYFAVDIETAAIRLEFGEPSEDIAFATKIELALRREGINVPPHLPAREGESAEERWPRELAVQAYLDDPANEGPGQIAQTTEQVAHIRAIMGEPHGSKTAKFSTLAQIPAETHTETQVAR